MGYRRRSAWGRLARLPIMFVRVWLARLMRDRTVKTGMIVGTRPCVTGAVFTFDNAPALVCCYHPSRQNTFTGRLTPDMLRDVLVKARELARGGV